MRNSFDQDLNPPKHWLDLKPSTTANLATPKQALFVMQCYAEQPKKKFLMISMHGNNAVVHKTIMLVLG